MKKIFSLLLCLLLCTGCAQSYTSANGSNNHAESTTTPENQNPYAESIIHAAEIPQQVLDFEAGLPVEDLFGFPTYYINSFMEDDRLTVIVRDPRETELDFMKSLPGGADATYINVSYNTYADLPALQEKLTELVRAEDYDGPAVEGSGIGKFRLHITLALNRPANQQAVRELLAPYFLPEDESLTDELRRLALPVVFEGDPTLVTLSELDALQTGKDTPEDRPNADALYMTPTEKHYSKGITSLEATWTVADTSTEYTTGAPYEVEKYIDGQWRMIGGGGFWTSEAYTPTTGFTSTFRFTSPYYDTDGLTPGHYRASKSVFPDDNYKESFPVYCYFEVK